jgi:hypothetical protein
MAPRESPGREGEGGPAVTPSRPPDASTGIVTLGADKSPDPWDGDLAVIRDSAESIPVWVGIWSARGEPDAHARRCASDAIDAIDAALYALHRTRARLVGQVRQADDATAERVDRLLARMREGPPGRERDDLLPPPPPQGSATESEARGRGGGDRR